MIGGGDPMGSLAVKRLPPRMELNHCIQDIWMFESSGGLSEEEMQLIVPNGSAKLMFITRGSLQAGWGIMPF